MRNIIYKELVKQLDDNFLSKQIKDGLSKNEITSNIISTFNSFFDNKNNLKRYANDFLIHDWINYYKIYYSGLDDNIKEIIDILRQAKNINSDQIFFDLASFQEDNVEMGNKYWSMCILERDISQVGDYEYVAECFNTIENICEILIKEFFYLIIHAYRISLGKNSQMEEVKKLSFGNLVNELKQAGKLDEFLECDNGISISQWRNIACHKSYKYNNGAIECKYGSNLSLSIILKSKEDLLKVTQCIYLLSQTINFAIKFFSYDNIENISLYYDKSNSNLKNRNETWHLLFVTELYTEGFRVKKIDETEHNLLIQVQELTLQDREKRAIQSLVLIYKSWLLTKKENIKIIYIDINGKPYLSSFATSSICEQIASGNKKIDYLIRKTIFKKL